MKSDNFRECNEEKKQRSDTKNKMKQRRSKVLLYKDQREKYNIVIAILGTLIIL